MDWHAAESNKDQLTLAQVLVDVTARRGWNRRALAEASQAVFGDARRWRTLFPHGAKDAIWFISRISDASMKAEFAAQPAADMAIVILTRFAQNCDLKAFVRQVMLFDMAHPLQALSRMQRTARVMMRCVGNINADSPSLTRLNIVYTIIVLIWLFDDTAGDRRTTKATRWAVRTLGL